MQLHVHVLMCHTGCWFSLFLFCTSYSKRNFHNPYTNRNQYNRPYPVQLPFDSPVTPALGS